jgi:hypothetical protein
MVPFYRSVPYFLWLMAIGLDRGMSALGQKQTCALQNVMSTLTPKEDMCGATSNVRFGPRADRAPVQLFCREILSGRIRADTVGAIHERR